MSRDHDTVSGANQNQAQEETFEIQVLVLRTFVYYLT